MENWTNCPFSISSNVDRLVDNIKPPQETEALRRRLQSAASDFKSALAATVHQHLIDVQTSTRDRFQQLQKLDLQKTRPIVERQLNRRLGRRLHQSSTRRALDELIDYPQQEAINEAWQQVQTKRKRPTGTERTTPPISTNNRFELLVDEPTAINNNNINMEEDVRTPQNQPQRKTKPTPKRLRPDEDTTSDDDLVPDTDDEETKTINTGAVFVHHPLERRSWKIKTRDGFNGLAVTDSNGSSWNVANLPSGFCVEAFRGGHIHDAAELLEAATTNLEKVQDIVVAMGLNDRTTEEPENVVLDLQRIRDWGSRHHKRLAFVEVTQMPSLTATVRKTIDHINAAAQDIFETDFIRIEQAAVRANPQDTTGIHYTSLTAKHIVSRIVDFLN
jgi:hypothetical protein